MTEPHVIVDRYPSEPDWTLSEFSINGVHRGYGVEDEHRNVKVKGETRVGNGLYEMDLRYSPKFSKSYFADTQGFLSPTKTQRFNTEHLLVWVKDVPNFEFVLWHWGNTDKDTDACYLVGSTFSSFDGRKGVGGSRVKYTEVYPILYQMITKNKSNGLKTFVQYRDKK